MLSSKFNKPDNWHFKHFKTRNGSRIRYGFACADDNENRGTVIITGGYGRHIEYYYESINKWLDRGYNVWAMDWEGQGGSYCACKGGPRKPSHRSFSEHADMFDEFVRKIVRPDTGKPAFLVSHSKGGNIMLRYLHKYEKTENFPFTAAILGTPMLKLRTYLPSKLFKGLVHIFNALGLSDTRLPAKLSLFQTFQEKSLGRIAANDNDSLRDKHQQKRIKETMGYDIGSPTMGWFKQAIRSAETVMDKKFLGEIKTPILILTSRYDPLVTAKAQEQAAKYLQNGEQETYNRARHGIWYDSDHTQKRVWRRIDDFMARLRKAFFDHDDKSGLSQNNIKNMDVRRKDM